MSDKVDFRFLSKKEKKGLTDNMLLLSDTNNFYETERLGGFSGLGSGHSGMTKDYHPSFVKSTGDTNPKKTASGLNELWSGSLSKHRWKKHGYSGKKEAVDQQQQVKPQLRGLGMLQTNRAIMHLEALHIK